MSMENEAYICNYTKEDLNPMVLQPASWNPHQVPIENLEKLRESIAKNGNFDPPLVRLMPDGSHEIVSGHHRIKLAQMDGVSKITVMVATGMSDKIAKQIALASNAKYGYDDALKLSELLKGMGTNVDELTSFLPTSDKEFEILMGVEDHKLDLDELKLDDDGAMEDFAEPSRPTKTAQMFRFKVPVGDAESVERAIKRVAKEQGFTEGDSLTNQGDALVYIINKFSQE